MKYKYIGLGAAGLALLFVAQALDGGFILGVALYLMAWGIVGDVLSGVTWQKHTVVKTKNVEYHNVGTAKESHEDL